MNENKPQKSGSAIFMYCVIALAVTLFSLCFFLHYSGIFAHTAILWTGVAAFTVTYHFWGRILMGNVTARWKIRHTHFWFRSHGFEKRLYRLLRVRRWKDKVLTYDPAAFDFQNRTLEELVYAMCKAETDHWINELISLSTILFSLLWGQWWIFCGTAVFGMLFDAQFIVVQRYNRPIVLRHMARKAKKEAPCVPLT